MAEAKVDTSAYEQFDKLAMEVEGYPAVESIEDSKRILKRLIDALPQRKQIKDSHAERWLHLTLTRAESRMKMEMGLDEVPVDAVHRHAFWHVRRASGFGGSEIGTLVLHARGENGDHTSAKNIVMSKLLIIAPSEGDEHTSRGVKAEPDIRRMYEERSGAVRDDWAIGKLKTGRMQGVPAIIGNPDDIFLNPDVQVPVNANNPDGPMRPQRETVDYKAPSEDVMAEYRKDGISFSYVCQLHHYTLVAMSAGIPVDKLSIRGFDYKNWSIREFEVPFDKELAKEIIRDVRHYWDGMVMKGEIPEKIEAPRLPVDDDAVIAMGYQLTELKVLQDKIEAMMKDVRAKIADYGTETHGVSVGAMNLLAATFKRDRAWDEDQLRDIAARVELNADDFLVPEKGKLNTDQVDQMLAQISELITPAEGADPAAPVEQSVVDEVFAIIQEKIASDALTKKKLNTDGLVTALEEQGVDLTPAMKVKESFALTRKKKGPEAERLAQLTERGEELAGQIDQIVKKEVDVLLFPAKYAAPDAVARAVDSEGSDPSPYEMSEFDDPEYQD